jgi:hypothetical protein
MLARALNEDISIIEAAAQRVGEDFNGPLSIESVKRLMTYERFLSPYPALPDLNNENVHLQFLYYFNTDISKLVDLVSAQAREPAEILSLALNQLVKNKAIAHAFELLSTMVDREITIHTDPLLYSYLEKIDWPKVLTNHDPLALDAFTALYIAGKSINPNTLTNRTPTAHKQQDLFTAELTAITNKMSDPELASAINSFGYSSSIELYRPEPHKNHSDYAPLWVSLLLAVLIRDVECFCNEVKETPLDKHDFLFGGKLREHVELYLKKHASPEKTKEIVSNERFKKLVGDLKVSDDDLSQQTGLLHDIFNINAGGLPRDLFEESDNMKTTTTRPFAYQLLEEANQYFGYDLTAINFDAFSRCCDKLYELQISYKPQQNSAEENNAQIDFPTKFVNTLSTLAQLLAWMAYGLSNKIDFQPNTDSVASIFLASLWENKNKCSRTTYLYFRNHPYLKVKQTSRVHTRTQIMEYTHRKEEVLDLLAESLWCFIYEYFENIDFKTAFDNSPLKGRPPYGCLDYTIDQKIFLLQQGLPLDNCFTLEKWLHDFLYAADGLASSDLSQQYLGLLSSAYQQINTENNPKEYEQLFLLDELVALHSLLSIEQDSAMSLVAWHESKENRQSLDHYFKLRLKFFPQDENTGVTAKESILQERMDILNCLVHELSEQASSASPANAKPPRRRCYQPGQREIELKDCKKKLSSLIKEYKNKGNDDALSRVTTVLQNLLAMDFYCKSTSVILLKNTSETRKMLNQCLGLIDTNYQTSPRENTLSPIPEISGHSKSYEEITKALPDSEAISSSQTIAPTTPLRSSATLYASDTTNRGSSPKVAVNFHSSP